MTAFADKTTALAICILAKKPTILWGLPGQGKTSIIEDMADHYKMNMETIIASTFEPADFGGLPVVDTVNGTVNRAAFGWAQRLADQETGIAFYDEISTAPPTVQAALLRPILSGWVGDLKLPDGIVSIAAANPPDIAADGWDLAPPMANRFVHLDWALDADTVREGFTVGWPKVRFPAVDKAELKRIRQDMRIKLGVFIGARPDLLTQMPKSAEESGRAFPTPRSWETAAELLAYAQAARVGSSVERLLVNGTVGVAAANEFMTFLANLDLPDPEVLLKDPSKFVVPSDRGDKVFAIAAGTWAAVQNNMTAERWVAYGDILAMIAAAGHSDVAYLYGRYWVKKNDDGTETRPQGAMPSKLVFQHLAPILSELGKLV